MSHCLGTLKGVLPSEILFFIATISGNDLDNLTLSRFVYGCVILVSVCPKCLEIKNPALRGFLLDNQPEINPLNPSFLQ